MGIYIYTTHEAADIAMIASNLHWFHYTYAFLIYAHFLRNTTRA
jgi:hypothetical protein